MSKKKGREEPVINKKEQSIEAKHLEQKAEDKPTQRSLRYTGKTINHFSHGGTLYQLIPNTVYLNLPDCEQVNRLIEKGELKEV